VFFNGFYPVIDYSSGGSANGYVDGMAKMLAVAKDATKIIPGHGPLGSKADLTASHDMLATVRDRVAATKKSGKSQRPPRSARTQRRETNGQRKATEPSDCCFTKTHSL
jgi:glyoxylase-like metal-dependent hydrolase (beta-lactamase superfamily II)